VAPRGGRRRRHVHPPPRPRRPGPGGAELTRLRSLLDDDDTLLRIGYGACVAIAIGSIGPWADIGPEHVLGIEARGSDGWFTLALAGLSAAVLWNWSQVAATERLYGVLLTGGLALALTLYDTLETSGVAGNVITVGWGLIVALIGSVVLVAVAGRLAMLERA
jgi:hypothetical protein